MKRFRGMFAYRHMGSRHERAVLRPRPPRNKPFYYFWDGETFVFGSEIKAILQHPPFARDFDESVLPEYLSFGYISDERDVLSRDPQADARPLARISFAAATPKFEIQQYWDVPAAAQTPSRELTKSGSPTVAVGWKRPSACG